MNYKYSTKTYKLLEEAGLIKGIHYWKVESYNTFTRQRSDLFHIIDVLALKDGVIGIQICGQDFNSHIKKMTEEYHINTLTCLVNGMRVILIGWRQLLKKRGGKARKWTPRIIEFYLNDEGHVNYFEKDELIS